MFLDEAIFAVVSESWNQAWWEVTTASGKGKGQEKGGGKGKKGKGKADSSKGGCDDGDKGKGDSGKGKGKPGKGKWREFDREDLARFPFKVKLRCVIDWQHDEDVQACDEADQAMAADELPTRPQRAS